MALAGNQRIVGYLDPLAMLVLRGVERKPCKVSTPLSLPDQRAYTHNGLEIFASILTPQPSNGVYLDPGPLGIYIPAVVASSSSPASLIHGPDAPRAGTNIRGFLKKMGGGAFQVSS